MTGPIRICHIAPSLDVGGRETRLAVLIDRLGDSFEHVLIALDGCYGFEALLTQHARSRVQVPERAAFPRGLLARVRRLTALLSSARPDVLATYNWGAIEAAAVGVVCRRWPVVHSEDGFGADEASGLLLRRALLRRLVLPHTFATVVPSQTLLDLATRRFGIPAAKVRFIPNGVDTSRFRPGRDRTWRRELGLTDEQIVIGTVGRLRPEKNLGLLLEAVAGFADFRIRLVIVGDGPCLEELRATAEKLGIGERVSFAGAMTDPERAYASMDVFAMSSSTEQMPVALLEAMAAGLPAVCTAVGDMREMLPPEGRAKVLVPPGDVQGLRTAIMCVVEDHSLRRNLGSANREQVIVRYSLDRMVEAYREMFLSGFNRTRPMTRGGDG